MAERRPLVLVGGRQKELPTGDTLPTMKLYPKTYVDTASGTFTLPATALPDVDVLLVGGGTSGAQSVAAQRGDGGDSVLKDSAGNVLLTAEGGKGIRPGRGGGTAARHSGSSITNSGASGVRGRFGYGCGGGAGPWESAGTGVAGSPAQAGTGDGGGGGGATSASLGGNGGGVTYQKCSLTPGETYTHLLGAGGVRTSGSVGESGGSGRIEYHYMDTVA